jgi:glycosyltransferase involved in cell wall biosynthesis
MFHYRLEFHRELRAKLAVRNVTYDVAVSELMPHVRGRNDTRLLEFGRPIRSNWLQIGKVILCWQRVFFKALSYDLVIVMHENKYLINYALQIIRSLGGPKIAFYGHGRNFQVDSTLWREHFKRLWMAKVDWWFAYTALSQRLIADTGFPLNRITSVDNAYDTLSLTQQLSDVSEQEICEFRAFHGIKSNNIGIFVGAFYKEKRISFLIACAKRVRAQVHDFELLLVGGGPDIHLAHSEAALHPWIHVTGPLFDRQRAVALKSSKVFLLPGLVGLAILDSFAAGVPIVTTDFPYHSPEIAYLRDGENGLMVSPGNDIEQFARAVVGLLANDPLRSTLAAAARADAARYNASRMAENFSEGIFAVLGKRTN